MHTTYALGTGNILHLVLISRTKKILVFLTLYLVEYRTSIRSIYIIHNLYDLVRNILPNLLTTYRIPICKRLLYPLDRYFAGAPVIHTCFASLRNHVIFTRLTILISTILAYKYHPCHNLPAPLLPSFPTFDLWPLSSICQSRKKITLLKS